MQLRVFKVPMCLLTKCHVCHVSLVTTVPLKSLTHLYCVPMEHTKMTLANSNANSVRQVKVVRLFRVARLIVKTVLIAYLGWLNVFLAPTVTGRSNIVPLCYNLFVYVITLCLCGIEHFRHSLDII